MEFDKTQIQKSGDTEIGYGILRGSKNIIFIKSGNGGKFDGGGGKYLRLGEYLRQKYGCSIICASNPVESKYSFREDMNVLCGYMREEGFSDADIYLIGNSDGCFRVIDIAENIRVGKMILMNMPLMINFYKTKETLKNISDTNISFIYGDHDPSIPYLPFLRTLTSCRFFSLPDTGHRIYLDDTQIRMIEEILF